MICDGLKNNSTLTFLDMESGRCGDEGAPFLGEMLKSNSSLKKLNLGSHLFIKYQSEGIFFLTSNE